MKVVLLTKYRNLGYPNDIINVADGFARNFLIPNGIAVHADKSEIKKAKENEKQTKIKTEKLIAKAKEIAMELEKNELVLKSNVDKNNKLFAPINFKTIKDEIFNIYNYTIDDVIIAKPLNNLGQEEIKVKLYKDVIATVKVNIEKK